MSLIYHDGAIVLVLQFNDLRQLGQVALHGEYTINDDQLDGLVRQLGQHALQVFHVVVLVVELRGKAQTASIDNARVVAVVTDDIVATAHDDGEHTLVDGETRRVAQHVFLADIFGYLFFELDVQVECAVEKSAACTARTIFVERSVGSGDDAWIAGKACVGVGAKHKNLMSVDIGYFGTLHTCDFAEIRVHSSLHKLLRRSVAFVLFL